jgi:hypothetical protein
MKHEDWIMRLWAKLEGDELRERPFQYGHCVRLAAEVLDEIRSDAPTFVAGVATLIAAAQESPITLADLERHATDRLGAPVPIMQARQGDVVLMDLPSGPALGICTGHQIACAALPKGVTFLRIDRGLKAWRVD